jgi:hypothetical protein
MEDREFDSALRDFVNQSELPYNPKQWDRMAKRLNVYESRKVIPVVRRPLAANPVYKWGAMAAAACLLVGLGWYIKGVHDGSDYNAYKQPASVNEVINTTKDATIQTQKATETIPAQTQATASVPHRPAVPGRKVHPNTPAPVIATAEKPVISPIVPASEPPETRSTTISAPVTTATPVTASQFSGNKSISLGNDWQPEQEAKPDRKMAYGVNGGYNFRSGKNNFTVGVMVKRKLSKRLNLETAVAVVGGSNETHETLVTTTYAQGVLPGQMIATTTTSYEPVTNNLLYLQAAPSLNYQLFSRFSAGGGADAQRLLTGTSKTIAISRVGAEEPAQPQWDFGLTARMDYQVFRKLKAGLMYRESVGAISNTTSDAAKRNYLLMQLSYTIY